MSPYVDGGAEQLESVRKLVLYFLTFVKNNQRGYLYQQLRFREAEPLGCVCVCLCVCVCVCVFDQGLLLLLLLNHFSRV